jgi:hypothetical protein
VVVEVEWKGFTDITVYNGLRAKWKTALKEISFGL